MCVIYLRCERLMDEIGEICAQELFIVNVALNILHSSAVVDVPRVFHWWDSSRKRPQHDFILLKLDQVYGIVESTTYK